MYVSVDTDIEVTSYVKTKFTEHEYRELCELFGFDFDIFDREEVDK